MSNRSRITLKNSDIDYTIPGVYVELDMSEATVEVKAEPNKYRWQLDCIPTNEAMQRELENLRGLFDSMLDGEEVHAKIAKHLNQCFKGKRDLAVVVDGEWWINEMEIDTEATDEELDDLERSIREEADSLHGVKVILGLREALERRREL